MPLICFIWDYFWEVLIPFLTILLIFIGHSFVLDNDQDQRNKQLQRSETVKISCLNNEIKSDVDYFHLCHELLNLVISTQVFPGSYICGVCFRAYRSKSGLSQHRRYECGKDPKFACDVPDCTYKAKRKENLTQHKINKHHIVGNWNDSQSFKKK